MFQHLPGVKGEVAGYVFKLGSFFFSEAVVGARWPGSRGDWLGVFFVIFKGFGLGLCEAFAVDLGLPPISGVGCGGKGWGETPADGGVEGVMVEVRDGLAGFLSLWVKVFAPPNDVVEVAVENAAVVAYCVEVVVEFR